MPLPNSDLVGEIRYTRALREDTLVDIARRFSVGQDEMVQANQQVDRWLPGEGTQVLLPKQFILPDTPHNGIVLNVPEMRLYYYRPHGKNAPMDIVTYPVSIGRMDWRTPLGTTKVMGKLVDPVWRPPATIKREHAADGDILPDVVPAGPNNPLGKYAMRLGVPGYLIHGTGGQVEGMSYDKTFGIGMRVTHGCVRMYPEDIEKLFPQIPVGTPVHIVNQPIKMGRVNDTWYIEVHQPLDEDKMSYDELLKKALDIVEKKNFIIDGAAMKKALQEQTGIPTPVSRRMTGEQPIVNTTAPSYSAPVTPMIEGQQPVSEPVQQVPPPQNQGGEIQLVPPDANESVPAIGNPQQQF